MHRGHAILAALVLGAAVWAYLVVHPLGGGAPSGEGAVTVWQVPERQVSGVAYRDGATHVSLQPRWAPDATSPTIWVQVGPAPTSAAAKAGAKASDQAKTANKGAANAQAKEAARNAPVPETFRGNATAQEALKRLATLTAERDLGRLAALDAKQFGFPAKDASLELTRRGEAPLKLQLGRATYGGTGRYAHNPADDHLYLLPLFPLSRLSMAASSLMDRSMLGLQPDEAVRMELSMGDSSRTFHHLSGPGRWGSSAQAAAADPDVGALAADIQRLHVLRYLPQNEKLPAGLPALQVRFFTAKGKGEGKPQAWLRIYGSRGNSTTAVSSYTERPVELPTALVRPLLEKARSLLHST